MDRALEPPGPAEGCDIEPLPLEQWSGWGDGSVLSEDIRLDIQVENWGVCLEDGAMLGVAPCVDEVLAERRFLRGLSQLAVLGAASHVPE